MQERVRPCAQSDIIRHGAIDDPALNPGVVKPACHVPVFFEAACGVFRDPKAAPVIPSGANAPEKCRRVR
jgi:hypothetical protein